MEFSLSLEYEPTGFSPRETQSQIKPTSQFRFQTSSNEKQAQNQPKDSSIDVIVMPAMTRSSGPNTPNKHKVLPQLSSAATLTDQQQIPVLFSESFKQESSQFKGNKSLKNLLFEPFVPMIRRRDKDCKNKKSLPRTSVEDTHQKTQLKRQQEKLLNLKENIQLGLHQLESQKAKLQKQRREHQEFIYSQRMRIQNQIYEMQRKRESLLEKQKLLNQNKLQSQRSAKEAQKYKLQLFSYKLAHALSLDQWIKSVKEEFFFSLVAQNTPTIVRPAIKQKKKLQRIKSCKQIAENNYRAIKYKSRSPTRQVGNSNDNIFEMRSSSIENIGKSEVKAMSRLKGKKSKIFRNIKSQIQDSNPQNQTRQRINKIIKH